MLLKELLHKHTQLRRDLFIYICFFTQAFVIVISHVFRFICIFVVVLKLLLNGMRINFICQACKHIPGAKTKESVVDWYGENVLLRTLYLFYCLAFIIILINNYKTVRQI